jgi:hypothetical protein
VAGSSKAAVETAKAKPLTKKEQAQAKRDATKAAKAAKAAEKVLATDDEERPLKLRK